MRVVVNRLSVLGQKTGIGHYTAQLLRCLREQAEPGEIEEYPRGWVWQARRMQAWLFPDLKRSSKLQSVTKPTAPSPTQGLAHPIVGRLRGAAHALIVRHFQRACRARGIDLYHEPNFIPIPTDLPTVVTLHDLSALVHPEWHSAERVAYYERHFRRGLKQCNHFLTLSEFGRQEVIRTLGIRPERVTAIHIGIRPNLKRLPQEQVAVVLQRLKLPPRYLLYVGTIEPRKNLLMLLRAYCDLPEAVRAKWPLLLVGGWGWNSTDVADYLHREARHRGVVHIGYVAEEHLAAIYNGARALLYPSFYEGFGLPPVEMMACGGAVLASTAGAVAEVVGGRACLIDPNDLAGWRDAMARVAEDDQWREWLRESVVDVARRYTWERAASQTLQVYRFLTRKEAGQTSRPGIAA